MWPFKDCILEGGTKQGRNRKEKKYFFNEILAQDEITQLLEANGFNKFKKSLIRMVNMFFEKFNRNSDLNKKERLIRQDHNR